MSAGVDRREAAERMIRRKPDVVNDLPRRNDDRGVRDVSEQILLAGVINLSRWPDERLHPQRIEDVSSYHNAALIALLEHVRVSTHQLREHPVRQKLNAVLVVIRTLEECRIGRRALDFDIDPVDVLDEFRADLRDVPSDQRDTGPVRRMRHHVFDGDGDAALPGAGKRFADHRPPARVRPRDMGNPVPERSGCRALLASDRPVADLDLHRFSAVRSRRL